jgi:hypothetical protein
MTVEIPLKRKYKTAHRGRYSNGGGGNNRPARQHAPLTDRERALHAAQPKKVMHLQANGKVRMLNES